MIRTGFIARGGLWTVAQGILSAGALVAGILSGTPSLLRFLIAVPFLLAGAGFGIRGVSDLGRSRSVLPEPTHGAELVRSGVYGRVRHPLYASQFWIGAAWIVATASAVAAAWVLGLCLLLVLKSRDEERRLERRFPEYPEYRRSVPAFFPGFR